jgi:hypothetical protein
MKRTHYYIVVSLAALALVLSIVLVALGSSNQGLQAQLQKQQEEINRGGTSQQVGTNILRDMASVSVKNGKMKDVLAKNGYNVTASPDPSASPSPAAPANP